MKLGLGLDLIAAIDYTQDLALGYVCCAFLFGVGILLDQGVGVP
jgi:hypothetical protein